VFVQLQGVLPVPQPVPGVQPVVQAVAPGPQLPWQDAEMELPVSLFSQVVVQELAPVQAPEEEQLQTALAGEPGVPRLLLPEH
jgi:hypothetical protein